MITIEDVRTNETSFRHVVLTAGSFDGVHLGHKRILDEVVVSARAANGTAAVLTLSPHPRLLFSPGHVPNLLTSDTKKFRLFEGAGVDVLFVLPFTRDVAQLEPSEFVTTILQQRNRGPPEFVHPRVFAGPLVGIQNYPGPGRSWDWTDCCASSLPDVGHRGRCSPDKRDRALQSDVGARPAGYPEWGSRYDHGVLLRAAFLFRIVVTMLPSSSPFTACRCSRFPTSKT